jgi:hypothetical protein
MIFAYHGPDRSILEKWLLRYGQDFSLEADRYWPEVVTVLDKGYYLVKMTVGACTTCQVFSSALEMKVRTRVYLECTST